jgi:hypothetical protein
LQARKVFVGGVPQTVDQNGLYQMFSKHGKVKKAWLQLFLKDQMPNAKNHRGFGFVIFYERTSIDQLLGEDFSRFVYFDDLKLEVKRSVGKTSLAATDEQPEVGTRAKSEFAISRAPGPIPSTSQGASPAAPQRWQNASPTTSQPPQGVPCSQTRPSASLEFSQSCQSESMMFPQSTQAGSAGPTLMCQNAPLVALRGSRRDACEANQERQFLSPPASQTWQSVLPVMPQSLQSASGQMMLVGFQAYVNLPCVPPFPFVGSSPVQWHPGTIPAASSTQDSPSQPTAGQQSNSHAMPYVPDVLLEGFIGRKPQTCQELKLALIEAMPKRYED